LELNNTKAFIVLKDGKIVLEKYFGSFTADSTWYWASAGKSLTSLLIGKAQEEQYLSLQDTSAKYLGSGWTNATVAQENNIKVLHQVTMTTGLNDGVPDNHCTLDTCLQYLAPAATRWAYHNAPYTLLEKVIENATGQNINTYTTAKIKSKIGMTGLWLTVDYDNVYYSKARSMARFALLVQNNCIWNGDTVLRDPVYKQQMLNSSQNINPAYGYLWWLNGKGSFMLPSLQFSFPGSYAPDAPADMYAALGKNGQIASIAPSKGLVVIRMGNPPGESIEVPSQFCNTIWKNLNYVMCATATTTLYTFNGNGNWTDAANWMNQQIPPAELQTGDQIIINPPIFGECVLNTTQRIPPGCTLTIVAGKKFRIPGNLVVE
jgi:CubicO group peptidase (beta-lactamase class C family)